MLHFDKVRGYVGYFASFFTVRIDGDDQTDVKRDFNLNQEIIL